MKVTITRPARSDIRQIFEYLEVRAGRRKAREIVAELRERCAGLQRMPERYAALPGYSELRRRLYRDYLIIYRIRPDSVEIIRVLHGASDYLTLLSHEETGPDSR